MATRTSSPPRSRGTTLSIRLVRWPDPAHTASTKRSKSSRSRSRSSSRRSGPGPLSRAVLLPSAAGCGAIWLGIAHLLGAVVRRIGSTARDLDPEHRRDGLGLGLVGLAVVVSAAEWWRLPGSVGDGDPGRRSRAAVGIASYAVPLLLLVGLAPIMRRPGSTARRDGRSSAGRPSRSACSA